MANLMSFLQKLWLRFWNLLNLSAESIINRWNSFDLGIKLTIIFFIVGVIFFIINQHGSKKSDGKLDKILYFSEQTYTATKKPVGIASTADPESPPNDNEALENGTLEIVFKSNAFDDATRYLLDFYNYYNQCAFRLYIEDGSILNFDIFDDHNKKHAVSYTSLKNFSDLNYAAITWESRNEIRLYLNGELKGVQKTEDMVFHNPIKSFRIGSNFEGKANYKGLIDEIRVAKKAFSEARIKMTYNNFFHPSSFSKAGKPQTLK